MTDRASAEGLRAALEEAILLPLSGGYQFKQAEWRRIATEYDRALRDHSDSAGLRESLARAIEGGYADDSIDADLYHDDPVYRAVVYEVRSARASTPRTETSEQ